jgi:hypothetical protein
MVYFYSRSSANHQPGRGVLATGCHRSRPLLAHSPNPARSCCFKINGSVTPPLSTFGELLFFCSPFTPWQSPGILGTRASSGAPRISAGPGATKTPLGGRQPRSPPCLVGHAIHGSVCLLTTTPYFLYRHLLSPVWVLERMLPAARQPVPGKHGWTNHP